MTDEVYTACPACEEEIPFYRTVDRLKECPECGTESDVLFDIAQGTISDNVDVAAADGGVVDE